MATLNISAKELQGWSPDIDARRSDKPQIMSGTNFVDDIDGPRAAFASDFVNFNFWDFATRGKVDELAIVDDIIYGTQTGVWRIDKTTGAVYPLLLVTVTKKFWPWTIAYVGGLYYLAQYDIGLWQYDPVNQTVKHIVTPVGDSVRFVNVSFGRLLYLTPTAVGVSALDDGTNLAPSLATAAQAQALALVGGTGLRIEAIPDGWLLFTTNGIMKATYTLQAYVFSYKNLSNAIKITTPNAGCYIPRLGAVCIDPSGLSITKEVSIQDNGIPQPWEVEKGDYIKKNILANLNANLYGTIDMFFSQAEQKLFISFSGNSPEGQMVTGLVYSLVNGRWGSFDIQHTGIFETYNTINDTYACSYMGVDGFMHAFNQGTLTQNSPVYPYTVQDYVYRPADSATTEYGVYSYINAAGVAFDLCTTNMLSSDNIPTAYKNFTLSGPYVINSTPYSDTIDDGLFDPAMNVLSNPILAGSYINLYISGAVEIYATGYAYPTIGLNSVIQVGPFRFSEQQYADETSAVSEIIVGLSQAITYNITEDWNIITGDEDWNSLTGQEDWNVGSTPPNTFDLFLRDCNDGVSMPFEGDETLISYTSQTAALMYTPSGKSAIWHILTLSATAPGQAFALKYIDFTGLATGRTMGF